MTKREKKNTLDYATLMVYTKIPERIFYGLLRHFGKDLYIKTNIFIEEEGKYNLETRLKKNLNTQSLYRGEQFWITDCQMVPKGAVFGVDLVDLLLGIVRHIIKNETLPFCMEEAESQKKKGRFMKHRLVIELLKIPAFYQFLCHIHYYEWDSHKELAEVNFKDYLDLFMAKNYKDFIQWDEL